MPSEYIALYQRACIVEAFPAYKLEELDDVPASLLTALQLRGIAHRTARGR